MDINNLSDLNVLKTAPELSDNQIKKLTQELEPKILKSDWITVGIMAPSDYDAIKALQSISIKYSSIDFNDFNSLKANGSVFLKGNQKTGNVYIRSENGLGEGILLTCQYEEETSKSYTYGPFPLNFFKN